MTEAKQFGEFRKVRDWLERHQIEFAAEHLDYFGGYRLLAFTPAEDVISCFRRILKGEQK
ncbi:hypothetical protein [Faecalibaculum rodentium]|uniref:hypothetical protein n=1 Tax=Faecalibaculum rodentium TaxID=1702221 RepID=UPI0025B74B9E|nr:hypothetical protein [Faecalibaculum rodentium]